MPNRKKYKYGSKLLKKLVSESWSIREVMTKLGIAPISGGMHAHIKSRIIQENIDTTHFKGKGANSGKFHVGGSKKLTPEEILVINTDAYKTKAELLRRALIEVGRLYRCEECGIHPIWQGKQLKLEVEHINGNNLDNRKDNVRFLCPNCHSQTDTFRKRKPKRH